MAERNSWELNLFGSRVYNGRTGKRFSNLTAPPGKRLFRDCPARGTQMYKTRFVLPGKFLAVLSLICELSHAQQPRQYTAQEYAAAEKFMFYNTLPLSWKGVVNAEWLADGRFRYCAADDAGFTYTLVDPATKSSRPMFDHDKIA